MPTRNALTRKHSPPGASIRQLRPSLRVPGRSGGVKFTTGYPSMVRVADTTLPFVSTTCTYSLGTSRPLRWPYCTASATSRPV